MNMYDLSLFYQINRWFILPFEVLVYVITHIKIVLLNVCKGGIIVSVMREEFFNSYEGQLEGHLNDLEKRVCLEQLERTTVDNYFCGKAGIVLCHRVLVSKC